MCKERLAYSDDNFGLLASSASTTGHPIHTDRFGFYGLASKRAGFAPVHTSEDPQRVIEGGCTVRQDS
ncbi:NAD-dependent dehydratase [Anopheles sinensis]|uniref:NAD-dependent dehydratase n=1 Tax=Anopheles sinensis TaxID=74873 RepID=A0A084WKK9_ANOSI|nr:NAD-dependent dehydratase [Anopheles sinensis]